MYICICNAVTDKDIRKAVDQGVSSVEGLAKDLNVATKCGRCKDCAKSCLNLALAKVNH